MNKIEEYKKEKDGLDVIQDLPRFAQEGWESLSDGDKERLKWAGIFFRRHTPGHFMMRIRIPNGISRSSQCRTFAEISREFGKGFVDITTRQQIQLRWFRIEQVAPIWDRLNAVGLTSLQTGMDNIRNVVGCPVAGLTLNELFDASPVARQFTEMFLGHKAYTNLPRKFNVTITGCKENCTHADTQDIALIPATQEMQGSQVRGFNVSVGGKLGSGGYRIASPVDVFVQPEEAAELCGAIVLIFRDHGYRESRTKARLAFLLDDWGSAKFREVLENHLGRKLERAGVDERAAKTTDHIGVFRQKQAGLNYVGLCVPVGRITTDQLLEVARLAEAYGNGEIRFTPSQNLIIPNVPDRKIGDLTAEPLLRELRYEPSGIMRGLVSCTGIDYCNLAIIETKNRALRIAKTLEQALPRTNEVTVHWSGCPAGCGNHAVADIGLLGKKARVDGKIIDAVNVFVGGSSGPAANQAIKLMEDVPCDDLPRLLEGLIRFGTFEAVRQQLRRAPPSDGVRQEPIPTSDQGLKTPTRTDEIREGRGKAVRMNGNEVAVFKLNGQIYAIENTCPHEGAPLAKGVLDGEEVICPLHNYRYNVKTGACSTVPHLKAKTYRVAVQGETFQIDQEL